MKLAVLLVARGPLPSVGAVSLLLRPPSSGGLTPGAALVIYLVALVLAVTAGILSDVAALRQQRLVRSVALALVTLLGLVSASVTLPLMLTSGFFDLPAPDIALAFAPLVVLSLAALGSLLLARSQPGTQKARSSGTDTATPAPSATVARQPAHRLALVSGVAAFYTPVAVPLAFLLNHLALAASGPPVCQSDTGTCPPVESPVTGLLIVLSYGLVALIIPAVGVAIVSAHVALSRLRQHAAPTRWRTVAWWGLILGYATFPVLMVLFMWAVLTGAIGGE